MKITAGTTETVTIDHEHPPEKVPLVEYWVRYPESKDYWIRASDGKTLSLGSIGKELDGLQALQDHIESQQP